MEFFKETLELANTLGNFNGEVVKSSKSEASYLYISIENINYKIRLAGHEAMTARSMSDVDLYAGFDFDFRTSSFTLQWEWDEDFGLCECGDEEMEYSDSKEVMKIMAEMIAKEIKRLYV